MPVCEKSSFYIIFGRRIIKQAKKEQILLVVVHFYPKSAAIYLLQNIYLMVDKIQRTEFQI